MKRARSRLAIVAMTVAVSLPAGAGIADSLSWTPPRANFPRAALEVIGTNVLVWSFDRFIRDGGELEEFRVGWDSIWDNIENRMEWDNNNFSTNNFLHPYHGSLYYNAARANGFGYWESAPFAFAGSYLWEFVGEANNPAYNDWINTAVGGMAFGETLYRLSDLVLDDTATGGKRFWRESLGLLIDPMRGFNRIFSGEWSRVGLNPPDRRRSRVGLRIETGLRSQGRESLANQDTSGAFVALDFLHGDPFFDDDIRPFDNFSLGLQLNFNDVARVGRMQIQGLLSGKHLSESEHTWHILGSYQYFEYIKNRGYEYGGQSVGGLWLSRFGGRGVTYALVTDVGLGLLLLGGTSSDVANFSGRTYDYGSGLTYRLGARLFRRGHVVAELRSEGSWMYTLNGVRGEYFVTIVELLASVPVWRDLGLGAKFQGYYRKAWYDDYADSSHWLPEVRGFVSLGLD
jgi:hypothetical protein